MLFVNRGTAMLSMLHPQLFSFFRCASISPCGLRQGRKPGWNISCLPITGSKSEIRYLWACFEERERAYLREVWTWSAPRVLVFMFVLVLVLVLPRLEVLRRVLPKHGPESRKEAQLSPHLRAQCDIALESWNKWKSGVQRERDGVPWLQT